MAPLKELEDNINYKGIATVTKREVRKRQRLSCKKFVINL